MNIGKDYPLYIRKPKNIDITAEEFNSLSYMGIASFFITWKVVVERLETGEYNIWYKSDLLDSWMKYKRFKDLDFWVYSSAEVTKIVVPANHSIGKMIEKHFQHRILL